LDKAFESEPAEDPEDPSAVDMSASAILLRLTRFISLLGTVAAHYIGFLDNRVLGEFKRRNLIDFERRLKRHDDKHANPDASMVRF